VFRVTGVQTCALPICEVKKIVSERLRTAAISTRQEGDLSPFSEESLKTLYDLMLSVRGTESLDNFRVFERICHFALIEGAKRNLKRIDTPLIQELFKLYGLKELPLREGRRLSMKTAQEIAAIKLKSTMEKNEAILQGIVKALSKNPTFGDNGVKNVLTSFMGEVGPGNVGISSLSLDLLCQGKSISIFWLLATSKDGIVQTTDIDEIIKVVTPLLEEYGVYSHKFLFSYVSNIEVPKIPMKAFDEVIWLREAMAEDLIGLSVGVEEDLGILIKSFESEIGPRLSQLAIRETMDITAPLSSQAMEVVQTLFVIGSGGHGCTKEAIKQHNKRLFMRKTMIQERFLNEAIQSGFAREQASQLEPSIPKAHNFLLGLLEKGPQDYGTLIKKLGIAGDAIVNSASDLGIIYKEKDKIVKRRLADYEDKTAENIKSLQKAYQNETIKQSEPGKWIEWLLSAYENSGKMEQAYDRYVVLTAIQKLTAPIEFETKKYPSGPAFEPVTKTPQQAPQVASDQTAETTQPVEIQKQPTPVKPTEPIDIALMQTLQKSGPMSIQEIDSQMKQQGYEQDIKGAVFRLIIAGKLKVVSST
jgi:hypothetical protein